jgi:hypothetical protein
MAAGTEIAYEAFPRLLNFRSSFLLLLPYQHTASATLLDSIFTRFVSTNQIDRQYDSDLHTYP